MSFELLSGILGSGGGLHSGGSQAAHSINHSDSVSAGTSAANSVDVSQFNRALGGQQIQAGNSQPSAAAGGIGGLPGGGGNGGITGMINGLLGGISDGSSTKGSSMPDGLLGAGGGGGSGGLGSIAGAPLGVFSNLVGHDSAASAASDGDVQGWLVNTFDHSGHSHPLGGNSGGGSGAPLAILGTLGQEAGSLIGLDKVFGSAQSYDASNGTNYASGGSPTYGATSGLGLGNLFGGSSGGGHSGH